VQPPSHRIRRLPDRDQIMRAKNLQTFFGRQSLSGNGLVQQTM
jgi:hypothetical protein